MKNTKLKIAAALVAAIGLAPLLVTGCTGSNHNDHAGQTSDSAASNGEKKVQYTCSMHPEVVQDKPGDCPKCGMKLVEKK